METLGIFHLNINGCWDEIQKLFRYIIQGYLLLAAWSHLIKVILLYWQLKKPPGYYAQHYVTFKKSFFFFSKSNSIITHPHCLRLLLNIWILIILITKTLWKSIHNYLAVYFSFSDQILQIIMETALNIERNLCTFMFLWALNNSNWFA